MAGRSGNSGWSRLVRISKWAWIKAGFSALVTAIVSIGYILARRKGEKIGAIKERAEADLERVSELEEAGDSGGLRDDILKRLK